MIRAQTRKSAVKTEQTDATSEKPFQDLETALEALKTREHSAKNVDQAVAAFATIKDLFNRTSFEADRSKSREALLQGFIDNFPSMLGYWTRDLINLHSNNSYANYFGKRPKEIYGMHIRDLLGETIFALNLPYMNGVLAGVPQTFEREIPTPDGRTKYTLASYVPDFDDAEVVGFFVVVTDISARKELEDMSKRLEAALYESSRLSSLGQMASGIAHEINNPIAIIYSNACLVEKELKESGIQNDRLLRQIESIAKTALRIEKIVDGLRAISRGRSTNERSICDIRDIVDQSLAICKNRFERSRILVEWKRPSSMTQVLCNDVQIIEILLIILNNAFDAISGKPARQVAPGAQVAIAVEGSNESQSCRIRISNNGPAISAENRDRIFLPFFTTKGKLGTGLGLKIAQDLAVANHGRLNLSPEPKTEFVLELEIARDSGR